MAKVLEFQVISIFRTPEINEISKQISEQDVFIDQFFLIFIFNTFCKYKKTRLWLIRKFFLSL